MDLTFQIPMQYCSLRHWILLSSPDTSITDCHFCFGPATTFFPLWSSHFILSGGFLCSSPIAYWTPSNLGSSRSGVISFRPFILFMGFSWPEYWSGLPFPPLVDHILSELSTMTYPSWVALNSISHSFTELHKPLHHDKAVIYL